MDSWKQAFSLAKFELRCSKRALFGLTIVMIPYLFIIVDTAPIYFETGLVLFDLFFLMIMGILVIWMKPKDFQTQALGNNLVLNPYVLFLHQLPIPNKILIKNRFVIYYIYAITFHTLFFILIYVLSSTIRAEMTIPQYIAFSIVWISFGVYWGSIFPASDIEEVSKSNKYKAIVSIIIFLAIVICGATILHVYTGYGVVYWSIILVKKWPIFASLLSIAIAFISTILWPKYAEKNLKRIDYMI